jgi:hypothetical protein
LPYTDIRDGLLHDGAPRVIHQNDSGETRMVAIGRPISARMNQGDPDDTLTAAVSYRVPALHALYADGTVRRITGYIPPRYTPRITTTPEENPMPVHTPNTPVTTLDEAATALAQFQESMAREAQANGHPREFGEWIDRAIAEIPGLRAVPGPDFRPQGNMHLALRITIPDANPASGRDTIYEAFRQTVRVWARENGHAGLTDSRQFVAYALAHPEIVDMDDSNTSGYLDNYSITTRRTTGASTRRVEFVRD